MSFGIYEAREIVSQARTFIEAAKKPENAAALAKLEAEDFDVEEQTLGEQHLAAADAALVDVSVGRSGLSAAGDAHDTAEAELSNVFMNRLKKIRAKLTKHDANKPLLDALNAAVRDSGFSHGALVGRVKNMLRAIDTPLALPGAAEKVTIRQVAKVSKAQTDAVKEKLDAFQATLTDQDEAAGANVELTDEKDTVVRRLDRWLAAWQTIAKCDFTEAELIAFGVPANVTKSRRRQTRTTTATEPEPTNA